MCKRTKSSVVDDAILEAFETNLLLVVRAVKNGNGELYLELKKK